MMISLINAQYQSMLQSQFNQEKLKSRVISMINGGLNLLCCFYDENNTGFKLLGEFLVAIRRLISYFIKKTKTS